LILHSNFLSTDREFFYVHSPKFFRYFGFYLFFYQACYPRSYLLIYTAFGTLYCFAPIYCRFHFAICRFALCQFYFVLLLCIPFLCLCLYLLVSIVFSLLGVVRSTLILLRFILLLVSFMTLLFIPRYCSFSAFLRHCLATRLYYSLFIRG
jgi:hypothetical protein